MAVRILNYCVGNLKKLSVMVVLTFLKHNGFCGQVRSSSQFGQVDSTADNFLSQKTFLFNQIDFPYMCVN